jgi:DNA polymerase-4
MKIRRIAHLDMDAFYGSCELLRYPQLRGLPIVIGGARRRDGEWLDRLQAVDPAGDWTAASLESRLHEIPIDCFPRLAGYTGRGVITTATYPARQFGVGSAMGLMKAARLCPDAILLPTDFDRYRSFSRRFKEVITSIAPVMEDRGIDEVYIDFTAVADGQLDGGRALAQRLQQQIVDATGLTCSIGVAPNKLIAKMASEWHKPNGITVVHEGDLQAMVWPLPCRKINGVGPKAEADRKSVV